MISLNLMTERLQNDLISNHSKKKGRMMEEDERTTKLNICLLP